MNAGRLIRTGRAPLALIALIALFALLAFVANRRTAPRPAAMDSLMTEPSSGPPDSNAVASARIAKIIETQAARLMALPGVHGIAEGRTAPDGRPCILLLVEDPTSPAMRKLPKELDGFPIRFDKTDSIRAFGKWSGPLDID